MPGPAWPFPPTISIKLPSESPRKQSLPLLIQARHLRLTWHLVPGQTAAGKGVWWVTLAQVDSKGSPRPRQWTLGSEGQRGGGGVPEVCEEAWPRGPAMLCRAFAESWMDACLYFYFILLLSLWGAAPCGMQDLSSLTRDRTHAPCSGSGES